MKKLILGIAILLLTTASTFAQKPEKGLFTINYKGHIFYGGTEMGWITKDSIIKNAKGEKVAFLKSDGTLEDADGKNLGKAGKNGMSYYNPNGTLVYTVKKNSDSTCNVYDAKGKKIGNVHDSYKGMACALHCFSNSMDMDKHKK